MDLKRTLTKRMRIKRSAAPDSIELPPKQTILHKQTGSQTSMMANTAGAPVQRTLGAPATFPNSAPHTPRTPSTDEFASIAFDGVASASPPLQTTSPSRSVRSGRSSRSASVASSTYGPSHFSIPNANSHFSAGPKGSAHPQLTSNVDKAMNSSPVSDTEPLSPDSVTEFEVIEADEMAQLILAKVRQGGQQKWSL